MRRAFHRSSRDAHPRIARAGQSPVQTSAILDADAVVRGRGIGRNMLLFVLTRVDAVEIHMKQDITETVATFTAEESSVRREAASLVPPEPAAGAGDGQVDDDRGVDNDPVTPGVQSEVPERFAVR